MVSLNDKDEDKIEGVKALQDFWIDIDARPKGIEDRQATQEEMKEALERTVKIQNHIENEYAAIGFRVLQWKRIPYVTSPFPVLNYPLNSGVK